MSEVISFEEAKKQGRILGEKLLQQDHKLNIDFSEILGQIEGMPGSDFDVQYLARLLALNDREFNLLAPAFLQELEKTYNTNENQLLLLRTMNLRNISLEDVLEEKNRVCEQINEQCEDILSPYKIAFLQELMSMTYNALCSVDGIAKHLVDVAIEYCNPEAKMPVYAHISDSGMDVFATDDVEIRPGETKLIPLGIKVSLPNGYELQVRPKSGRSLNSKLRIANTPGTIDAGYRDEVAIIVENVDQFIRSADIDKNGTISNVVYGQTIYIGKGEKFAQLVLNQVPKVVWRETEHVFDTPGENRGGGFGSTGDK